MAEITLGLPSTVLVGRAMPKKAFYEHLKTTAAIKDEFVQKIERIELVAALKEVTARIPAGEKVVEIDVLRLELKAAEVPCAAIELIAQSVPNKVLFACTAGDECKLLVLRDRLRETTWMPGADARLELAGSNLDELWDSLCSQVVFDTSDPTDFTGRLARANELASLRGQLEKLRKRHGKERQIAKRNALWDEIKATENRIAELEAC